MSHSSDTKTKPGTQVLPRTPSMYKVMLLNDDFTPMEFVVQVLIKFFRKNEIEATEIMLHVHHKGYGIAGVYPLEIAETKVIQVNSYSQMNQYPLKCILEKE